MSTISPSARNGTTAEPPFVALLRAWPNPRAIADDLQIPYFTVVAWFRREYVALKHWEALVAAARKRGLSQVTYHHLRLAAAERQRRLAVTIGTPRAAAQDAPSHMTANNTVTANRKHTHAV